METNENLKLDKFCPYCGGTINFNWKYCSFCGKRLHPTKKPSENLGPENESIDINYKWQVIGCIGVSAIFVLAIILTSTLSSALTANTIEMLFTLLFIIVLFMALFILGKPQKTKSKIDMNNPLVALLVAFIAGIALFYITKYLN